MAGVKKAPGKLSIAERAERGRVRSARAAEAREKLLAEAVELAKQRLIAEAQTAEARALASAARSDEIALDEAGQKFLVALASGISVTASAKAAGLELRTVYARRDASARFRAEWSLALDMGADRVEDEIFRRGVLGVEEPVFQGGKLVGTKRVFSDQCAIRTAERKRPELWRDRKVVHTGAGGGPIQVAVEAKAKVSGLLAALGAGETLDMTIGDDGVARVTAE